MTTQTKTSQVMLDGLTPYYSDKGQMSLWGQK